MRKVLTSRVGIAALACLAPALIAAAPAGAQTVSVPQLTLLLPNYEHALIGDTEALEGGAFVARAGGAVATFYNPAGLGLV